MQTATDATSANTLSSYPSLYNVQSANHAADAERHALKRTYLTLLPHPQLVELCLAFEAYSPPHVKSSLWPLDLKAAVTGLHTHTAAPPAPPPPPVHHESSPAPKPDVPPAEGTKPSEPPPMGSLSDDLPTPTGVQTPQASPENTVPAPTSSSNATTSSLSSEGKTGESSQPSHPPSTTQPSSQPVASTPQGAYPHPPYGYPPSNQQSAYPHAPYYPPHPSFVNQYPLHLGSAPYPQANFPQHTPYPSQHPPGSPFTNAPLTRHPLPIPPPDPNSMPDGLPSYEDMIVEALGDLGDPEGCAPKALFSWMASHYPLHTNFRPSASQALQKAFKRGRLEKSNNGKYRLNINWDGPPTTKRTTRRPQTITQLVSGQQGHGAPTSSPFTHAPLTHHHLKSAQSSTQSRPPPANAGSPAPGQLPYPGFPFPYPHNPAYPGYPPFAPYASAPAGGAPQAATPPAQDGGAPADGDVGEGSDAWEAAQSILKAINFGGMLQALSASSVPAGDAPAPPLPVLAAPGATSGQATGTQASVLSEGDRAALQAQLALLAAQLAEIADDSLSEDLKDVGMDVDEDEDLDADGDGEVDESVQPAGAVGMHAGEDEHGEGEDDSDADDDDMEMVHIPSDALRT